MTTPIHELVRDHYAGIALNIASDPSCSGNGDCCGTPNYSAEELASLPDAAALASLGCGNPLAVADLHEGDRVLDLGSGGGIDVLLSGLLHASHSGSTGDRFGSAVRPVVLVQAGTATSTRGRGESNSFNHLVLDRGVLEVQRQEWDERSRLFVAAQVEQYEKRSSGWVSLAPA